MAHQGSKGWYITKLKEVGISKHPQERRKLEHYKTAVLANLYFTHVEGK